ncbi:aspartate--tRNA(Asn) ligase [Streptacidiphilus sp. PB12-B1b]|uniref:aspartate--tRNA(Asn) ligase n=1 Tax=Streptacidiphilus sp. PB12-B1b TaxID=2705012 RepID=UPI0015FA8DB2|nr:aspartate--tRNA(Asn) ligase [Streptacidiphilus sp. PB12-B1b]QMU75739.1 aspartate--tRNA(Asn) ligase [Streptacidiphilus sp. PB12-B1b]
MIRTTPRVLVSDLREHLGETVSVCGWVNTLRLQRTMQFLLVRDHTGTAQVTHRRADAEPLASVIEGLTAESAIRVTGRVVANPIVKLGGLEIVPETVEVLNRAGAPLPLDEHSGPEHRLDWRFLDVRRRPAAQLLFAVQTTVEQAMREFAYAEGCTEMHTPKLMGSASESGAEVFRLDYFERSAYLAQSPQFYKQMAIAAGIDRVFEIGPVFRAEPSFTSRHATEFTGVDVELAWIDGVEDVMAFEERLLAHTLARVAATHGEAVREHFGVEVSVPALPFPRITLAEALAVLRAQGWDQEGAKADLDPEGERRLAAHIREQTGHPFVFVTHYPVGVRPFYHMRSAEQPGLTLSFDLLWKGLEITTGAQREHRYDVLTAQAAERGLGTEPLRDYLRCFRYGCPPHGGLGLGLARLLMVLLGLDSIRDAVFLFRGPTRLTP